MRLAAVVPAGLCWRTVTGDHADPFQHHYTGFLVVVVRFTYFPRDALDKSRRALDGLAGTRRHRTTAEIDAANDPLHAGSLDKNAASCG